MFIDTIAPADAALDTHLQAVEVLRDASHVRNYRLAEWVSALGRAGFGVMGVTPRRLRLEFGAWTARTRTPAGLVEAIRALQEGRRGLCGGILRLRRMGVFRLIPLLCWLLPLEAGG